MFLESDLPPLPAKHTASAANLNAIPGLAHSAKEFPVRLRRYLNLFTFLADKAVWEYTVARQCMLNYNALRKREPGLFVLPFEVLYSVENCVVTLHRLVRLFRSLSTGADHFIFDGPTKPLIESYFTQLNAMRDAIQHTETQLVPKRGQAVPEIAEGTPIYLSLKFGSGRIELGSHAIRTADLAAMVTRLHELAYGLAQNSKGFDNLPNVAMTNKS